ncbi:hypothetical protein [Hyperthermus butylicus]|uniref:hypothetical protein n=1 Tax=Hyperthermus butylicus TaxID=54248 RepID=UPI000323BF75|nr:hypothetical protein [Hyperthermus butylicus]
MNTTSLLSRGASRLRLAVLIQLAGYTGLVLAINLYNMHVEDLAKKGIILITGQGVGWVFAFETISFIIGLASYFASP